MSFILFDDAPAALRNAARNQDEESKAEPQDVILFDDTPGAPRDSAAGGKSPEGIVLFDDAPTEKGLVDRFLDATGWNKGRAFKAPDYSGMTEEEKANVFSAGAVDPYEGMSVGMRNSVIRDAVPWQGSKKPAEPPPPSFEQKRARNRQRLDANREAVITGMQRLYNLDDRADAERQFDRMHQHGVWDQGAFDKAREAGWGEAVQVGAQNIKPMFDRSMAGIGQMIADSTDDFVLGNDARRLARDASDQLRRNMSSAGRMDEDSWKHTVADTVPSLATQLPFVIAGTALRSPSVLNASLGVMGVQKFGQSYADGTDAGLMFSNNMKQAVFKTIAEVGPEKLSLSAIEKLVGKVVDRAGMKQILGSFIAQQGTEHATEQMTTVLDFMVDRAYTNPDLTFGDLAQQAVATFKGTLIQAPILGAAGTTVAGAMNGAHRLMTRDGPGDPGAASQPAMLPEVGVMSRAANQATAAGHLAPIVPAAGGQEGGAAIAGDPNAPSPMPELAQGGLIFPDPHELGVTAFAERARKLGLQDDQIRELAPSEPRDAVTGFFRVENRVPTVQRAQEFSAANDVPAWYVEADIANLGGLNDHFGNNHTLSNRVYRDIADIFADEMAKSGARSIPIRQGGDEINAVIIGGSPESVQVAIRNASARVQDYAVANGLSEIPHPKGKAPGVGLYSGYSPIRPGRSLDEIFSEAAHQLDQGKKGAKENVGRIAYAAADGAPQDQRSAGHSAEGRGVVAQQGPARSGLDGGVGIQADSPLAAGNPAAVIFPADLPPAVSQASPFGREGGVILFDNDSGPASPVAESPDATPRAFTSLEEAMPDEGTVNAFLPGANYVPFIQDTLSPSRGEAGAPASTPDAAGARGKPIRREDILILFMKSLGAGIYEGRVKGKNRLGFFRPKLEEVRIKRHADLETAAHELAHLIDSRAPEIRNAWSSGPNWEVHREELRGVSYDSGKIYEGFAEFVRLFMTQPDVARAKAPKFSEWFDGFVQRHEYGPAIRKAQEGMSQWFGQDAIDRARSKIGDHRPLSDALDGIWDNLRQFTVDDLHGIYRMELELKGGKIEPVGAYESARLSRASHAIADGALRFGAPVKKADGSFGWKGKGLEEIFKPVAEHLDDALLYFVGRSAHELMTQGREHLFTPGEISAMLELRTPEREKAFREYQQWNSTILDFAEAQGVINPEARALWKRTQYLPFHRIGESGGFKGKPGDWSGVKALTGGTENVRDILGNMTSNAAMLIDKAVKNEARQKVAALAELQGGGKFMAKIPPDAKPILIAKDQALDALMKAMGIDKNTTMAPAVAKAVKKLRAELEGSPAMLEVMQQGLPPSGGNVVAVLSAGKPTWYEVGDPILYRALQAIDRQPAHWLIKWIGFPKRIGQMSITLTPEFMMANIARDTIAGGVMSRAEFRPVIDSLQGMRLRLTKDPLYREFIANGGGMSSMFLDETRFRAKLKKFYQRQGIDYRTVLDTPEKLLGAVETIADAFEMSTRLGEYRRAIQRGDNPRHAAYLGRDVSTDFAMKGDSQALGFLYDTVMFLRPALVSWDRLYRGLAHDPNRVAIVTKTGLLALVSAALYLLNKDDERYKDLPDWDRDTHWHFFVGDQHFRWPKIWEIGAVASIAERTVEKTVASDPAGFGKDLARIIGNTFHLNLMPQLLAPLQEQATNRNGFTDTPIETPGMDSLQPFLRAKPTTSETMKAIGMATRDMPEPLQVNPVRAEALLRGYLNTWAAYGLLMSDKAFFGDTTPTLRTDQLPVARRFYAQEPALHTKHESKFYDMLEEAKRLRGTLRELDHLGRSDLADQKEQDPMAGEAQPLERAAKNLRSINADMLKARRATDLTPDQKRKRLDELTAERNALFKATVQDAKQAQEAKKQAVP
jgi:hypothetical protein